MTYQTYRSRNNCFFFIDFETVIISEEHIYCTSFLLSDSIFSSIDSYLMTDSKLSHQIIITPSLENVLRYF